MEAPLAGKVALVMNNDPESSDDLFAGKTRLYYGRWSYKYEEAARQGAAGALIIHETDAAGYGWDVVSGSWAGAQYDLVYQEERGEEPEINHFVNAGVSIGLADSVFLSGRLAVLQVCETQDLLERCQVDGRRQGMLTITAVLGTGADVQP